MLTQKTRVDRRLGEVEVGVEEVALVASRSDDVDSLQALSSQDLTINRFTAGVLTTEAREAVAKSPKAPILTLERSKSALIEVKRTGQSLGEEQ